MTVARPAMYGQWTRDRSDEKEAGARDNAGKMHLQDSVGPHSDKPRSLEPRPLSRIPSGRITISRCPYSRIPFSRMLYIFALDIARVPRHWFLCFIYTITIHTVIALRRLTLQPSLRKRKLSEYPVMTSLILLCNFVLHAICRFKQYCVC